jgi:hypothetical protein
VKRDLKKAISEWVTSLTCEEAKTKSVFLVGKAYTPLQILEEVEQETVFGTEFLTGLCALNDQMIQENPRASIFDLIRESVKQGSS